MYGLPLGSLMLLPATPLHFPLPQAISCLQDPCILINSLSPNRLIPILVKGMKYSEIDIILLKVS